MDAARKSDLLDLTLALHATTDRAIRVSTSGSDGDAVWLPLAHCDVQPKTRQSVVVTLPEWLAYEKGLI